MREMRRKKGREQRGKKFLTVGSLRFQHAAVGHLGPR